LAPATAGAGGAEPAAPGTADAPVVRDYRPRDSHSAQELAAALARHGGNQSRAAQSLGLTPRQFAYRWRKLHAGTASMPVTTR
jgi:Nif-specific regulatory protein